MHSSVNPSVSLFITEIRNTAPETREAHIFYEMKKLSRKEINDEETELHILWKKLYILSLGLDFDALDFVKAAASKSLEIKRLGYLGLSIGGSQKYLILMQNTVQMDLNSEIHAGTALGFVSNEPKNEDFIGDLVLAIRAPQDTSGLYLKYIVARGKYDSAILLPLVSVSESILLVKLQMILNQKLEGLLQDRDIGWMVERYSSFKCPFLQLKTIQFFYNLYLISKLLIDDKLVRFLRGFLIHPNVKTKKHIEIALALEALKLLVAIGRHSDKAEEFIFRLISSRNINSQFLGLKCAIMFGIMTEVSISRIFEVGIDRKMYFDSLMGLINETNFKIVYQRINEFRRAEISKRTDIVRRNKLIMQLLMKLCEFGDQEFICKAIYENPNLYRQIRNKRLLSKEQSRGFFKLIVESQLPEHFIMIYDLFPVKAKSKQMVAELGASHMRILVRLKDGENTRFIFRNLIDFLCMYGDPELNRQYIIKALKQERGSSLNDYFKGIEIFNIVLSKRMFYIGNDEYAEYHIKDGRILVISPDNSTISVEISHQSGSLSRYQPVEASTHESKSEISDGYIAKSYSIDGCLSLRLEVCYKDVISFRRIFV